MKKLFLLIVCAVTAIAARAQYSGSGNGTESDPYLIYNETQLYQMSNYLNKEGVVFKLMKDLDLTEFISENFPSEGWTPVGVESSRFKGKFYGNNHTISGLYINKPRIDNIGLFGYIEGATIQDLNLIGSSINGNVCTGMLCGRANSSTISDCRVQANTVSGNGYIGGLIGFISSSQINDCSSKALSIKFSAYICGGFCGFSESSTFQNCTSEGDVINDSSMWGAGGFVGYICTTNFTNCSSNGNVTGASKVGGFVGVVSGTCQLNSCNSVGNIFGKRSVAGFAGTLNELNDGSSVSFNSCHHKGSITNTGEDTGGIVATSYEVAINGMENCSHFGDISGTKYVGGLIGKIIPFDNPTLHRYSISFAPDSENYNATTTATESITSYDGSLGGGR